MRKSSPETFIKANLTRVEAERLYDLGREATIWVILEITSRWGRSQDSDAMSEISTPSGQIPVYKKPNIDNRRRKKPGAKFGHPGTRREIPPTIDEEKVHSLDECPSCGEALGAAFEQRERIVEDIPEVKPIITKHIIKRYRCKSCGRTHEAIVAEALSGAAVGNNVVALTAWMHYGLGTTLSQIIAVLNSHLSFKISEGGLVDIWRRLSKILDEWYGQIALEARSEAVLHADETGWRVNGKTYWLWCFSSKNLTCYFINRSRGSPALLEFMGETFSGTLITDFWPAYNRIACEGRQYCLAHMFRELDRVDERNKSGEWKTFRKKLMRIFADAMRLKKSDAADDAWESRYARVLDRLNILCGKTSRDADVNRLSARVRKYSDGMFTFLIEENVDHTNNHAEREIRPAVIMRKVIQQNRSDRGAHTQEVLMSVFRTLKLRGHDPMKTVVSALSDYLITGTLPPLPVVKLSDG
jgi:DNA-directed RNA polymerase subunit N (RpoN/RPB10)